MKQLAIPLSNQKTVAKWLVIPQGGGVFSRLFSRSTTLPSDNIQLELDLLHLWHVKIEAWILEQAGIQFDTKVAPGALRVVKS